MARPHRPSTARARRLTLRAAILDALRAYFHSEGFLEVQTPLLIRAPIPEASIATFAVPQGRERPDLFLIPSPEVSMKRLLAEGFEKIFQMGPVFRMGERGERHLPEFTLLEWYRTGQDYHALMADCEAILTIAARAAGCAGQSISYQGGDIRMTPPFPRLPVKEAFETLAGWTPGPAPDPDRFDEDMVEKVEPGLPQDRPVFLTDYPAACASLARLSPADPTVAERVEWYAGGLELANGFTELTDPEEQAARFREEARRRRELGLRAYPWPEEFLLALRNLPPCAGMALGVDRLVMLVTDAPAIDDVVAFPPGG